MNNYGQREPLMSEAEQVILTSGDLQNKINEYARERSVRCTRLKGEQDYVVLDLTLGANPLSTVYDQEIGLKQSLHAVLYLPGESSDADQYYGLVELSIGGSSGVLLQSIPSELELNPETLQYEATTINDPISYLDPRESEGGRSMRKFFAPVVDQYSDQSNHTVATILYESDQARVVISGGTSDGKYAPVVALAADGKPDNRKLGTAWSLPAEQFRGLHDVEYAKRKAAEVQSTTDAALLGAAAYESALRQAAPRRQGARHHQFSLGMEVFVQDGVTMYGQAVPQAAPQEGGDYSLEPHFVARNFSEIPTSPVSGEAWDSAPATGYADWPTMPLRASVKLFGDHQPGPQQHEETHPYWTDEEFHYGLQ